jgi:hypothetical protein
MIRGRSSRVAAKDSNQSTQTVLNSVQESSDDGNQNGSSLS